MVTTALGLAALVIGASQASAFTIVVSPDSTTDFAQQAFTGAACAPTTPTAPNQTFVAGPGDPPLGEDSLRIVITDAAQQEELVRTAVLDGTPILAAANGGILSIEYSTYVEGAGAAPYLRLAVDKDGNGTPPADEYLYYFPGDSGNPAVTSGTWQTWVITQSSGTFRIDSPTGATTTLGAYGTANPDAKIMGSTDGENANGGVAIIQGCSNKGTPAGTSYVDRFVYDQDGPGGNTYDFETSAATLTLDRSSGQPGSNIVATGTQCPYDDASVQLARQTSNGLEFIDSEDVVVTNGNFTATLTVPTNADPADTYLVEARCSFEMGYPDQPFDVQPGPGVGAGGALAIDPSSGPAGSVINVSGTACGASTANVFLGESRGESGGPVAESNNVPVNSDGTFSTTLTVPSGSDPSSTYNVGAQCGSGSYGLQAFDVTGMTGTNGYRMVAADGGIFTFGDRTFHGSTGDIKLNKPIVGGATDKGTYDGYWIVASDGGVFTFNAPFYGSLGDQKLAAPATEIEPTPTGKGYWIVTADGKVYPFGDAGFFGDMGGKALNKPVIGMSVTPTGKGYWLVGEDGGIFNFGDAGFYGSTGNLKLNAPVIDLAPAVDNNGYYLLAKDGGVFTFGSADFKGSTGDMKLNAPVIAMLVSPTGAGYWLAATDGGIFTFGAVDFLGSMGGTKLNSPVLDLIN
ncbi:MAG TPA: hypothetical protein VM143_08325 [Acidimicrobiales bacterium]|nr:hypothetical protein [Acidimicrobiales bacterium]